MSEPSDTFLITRVCISHHAVSHIKTSCTLPQGQIMAEPAHSAMETCTELGQANPSKDKPSQARQKNTTYQKLEQINFPQPTVCTVCHLCVWCVGGGGGGEINYSSKCQKKGTTYFTYHIQNFKYVSSKLYIISSNSKTINKQCSSE